MLKFEDMPYTRPNLEQYQADLRQLMDVVQKASAWSEIKAAWLEQADRRRALDTNFFLASIRNRIDARNSFYEQEMAWLNGNLPAAQLVEKQAEATMLASPFLPDFEAEFGTQAVKMMRNNQRFSNPAIVPLQVKELQLQQQYSKVMATSGVDYHGKRAGVYDLLREMRSDDRAVRHEAFTAWSELHGSVAEQLEEIYDQMVKVRCDMASVLGFDSYIDMAYAMRRRFDYTPKDVADFRSHILKYVTPLCNRVYEQQRQRLGVEELAWYDESQVLPGEDAIPQGTEEELLAMAQQMYHELAPQAGEYFDFVVDYHLYDLTTKPGKRPGGFCSKLPSYHAPFIFANFNGTAADLGVLTHEAGHGFEEYVSSRIQPLPDQVRSTTEINEIHSMAMEHFTYPWMERFFGKATPRYLYQHLWDALSVLPYMCCVDEFQHRVFEQPAMPKEERRALWHSIERVYMPWRHYAGDERMEKGCFWLKQQHIFIFPFYYIDYALAQICAFQFYLRDLENHEKAWSDYMRLCRAGGSVGYFDLLKLAKLQCPFDEQTVQQTIAKIEQLLTARRNALSAAERG